MDRLVPTFVLEQYAAGEQGGRLTAAVLFIDVSGFAVITDTLMERGQHGAEVLAATMRAVFDPLVRAVYEQGGFITGFAGDAFTAVFSHEDEGAARDALAAAWRIARHARRQTAYETPYGAFAISVKAGLSLGDVAWGIVTAADGQRASYYFEGAAIDGAAAAQQHARPGEIVLDAPFCRACAVQVEAVGEGAAHKTEAGAAQPSAPAAYFRLVSIEDDLPPPRSPNLPEPEPDLLRRFVSPDVVRQRVSGEFRQVVSVAMSLPTVRTAAQLAIFAQTVFSLLKRYGGLLNRLDFGDKGAHLVLFWGAPVAHENDVERALNFILDLQEQTAIPLNAGVTYRIAHAGRIGGQWRSEYTCYGRGINLAARFMTTAPRGEIWVDENVARRAAAGFDLELEGPMAFKGFAGRQTVYALLERKETAETFYDGPLVGREAELAQLADFLRPLADGRSAGVIVVWGEAGIGKSRLLHAFRASRPLQAASPPARGNGPLWAFCQTDEILRRSLNPFRYWLRHYFGISAALADARNKRAFNRRLDDLIAGVVGQGLGDELAAELDATRSFLGALVDLRWPDSLYEQLDAQARYENTLAALSALLRAESVRQPVVVLLEDAHWLDEESKAFLPRLLQTLAASETTTGRAYPIAIVATARPESDGLPLGDLDYDEIHLERLEGAEVARLVEDALGGPPAPSLLELVAERAEGNPFFAGQIVRFLQEEGRLQPTPAGWDLAAEPEPTLSDDPPAAAREPGPGYRGAAAPLPADVRALLAARLDRLPPDVRDVVETAAVLGREFEGRLLARMVGDGGLQDDAFQGTPLHAHVRAAEEAGVWSPLDGGRYLFKHALLRDTAYRAQVHVRRQELHALAVSALESLYAGELAGHYGELAHHSERAGDDPALVEKARRYLGLAGDAAAADYQNALALNYYDRALALTPAGDLEARYELHLAREAIFRLRGQPERRRQALATLAELAAALGDPEKAATVALRRAHQVYDTGDLSRAIALMDEATALARDADATGVVVEAYGFRASALKWHGRLEAAAQLAKEGRDLARAAGNRRAEGIFLNLLGMITLDQEAHDAAGDYFAESLACARAAGDRRLQAQILNNLGKLLMEQHDYTAGQAYYEQALVIAREIGERSGEGLVLGNLGRIADVTGEHEKARDYYSQSLRIMREVGDRLLETYSLINLSACLNAIDDDDAGRYADEALALARETGDPSAEAWALTYLGHCHLAAAKKEAAAAAYEEALAIRRELRQEALATEPAAGAAAVRLAQGDPDGALACLEEILPLLDGRPLEGTDDPLRVYLTAYRVLDAAGDPRAATILQSAVDILQAQAERIPDEDVRRSFLQRNPAHRAIRAAWQVRKEQAGSSG